MEYYDGQGRRITLGRVLGRGGEGSVHEVSSIGQNVVAKVYHDPLAHDKQAKLRAMIARADDRLKDIAAWPIQTLHPSANGPVRGFLMPRASNAEPLHHLYGPAHRKQQFPSADWAFLVNAARNVAAAFSTIHASGCVIGDVNPNLVFVARNSLARLIDCDSFQIPNGKAPYLCEVGVPHFTAPELQGLSSFKGLLRTPNHDNFGLALLVFHLLLLGRHPFFGVYSGQRDMPPEKAIQEFRYAYAVPVGKRGMRPPPNTVGPEILPPAMAAMFERAFSEDGAKPGGRPTATDWITALNGLKVQLRECATNPAHRYYGGLGSCPWCELERQTGYIAFLGVVSVPPATGAGGSSFHIGQVWAAITGAASPGTAPAPAFVRPADMKAKPPPTDLRAARMWRLARRCAAVGVVILGIFKLQHLLIGVLIVAAVLFFGWNKEQPEVGRRKEALANAKRISVAAWSQWNKFATDKLFQEKLAELRQAREEYEDLGNRFTSDRNKLQANVRELQLRKYLEGFFISDHDIPGIGPVRKATLSSFGVESAADISWNRVKAISGFGEQLTRELVGWRKRLEGQFVFDPAKGVDPADIVALQQRYVQLRSQLEAQLTAGPEALRQISVKIERQRTMVREMVLNADQQVAQAELDLKVVQ
ncbi:helix-hairpin-helix domain-containing protein [Paraburkholderia tagetis]|uniref:Helix-hairpin-helix domain-containing protein n=1 Tax=Paraburkholderia tagetis TaxID=2913261 RepID=A0A9X1ULK8_9BURK|nr:helix-hairpin-helix domain-containing protein [Paraburkholderia tagetis]MCG5077497.1 helix-hairpin-helix domain-containing protein [Paraburkholderia tagetis]